MQIQHILEVVIYYKVVREMREAGKQTELQIHTQVELVKSVNSGMVQAESSRGFFIWRGLTIKIILPYQTKKCLLITLLEVQERKTYIILTVILIYSYGLVLVIPQVVHYSLKAWVLMTKE